MHSNFIFSSWLVQSAVGWDYQAQLAKHQSQTDAAKGFGGKFGVQKDKKDKVMAIDKISVTRTSCLFSNFFLIFFFCFVFYFVFCLPGFLKVISIVFVCFQ